MNQKLLDGFLYIIEDEFVPPKKGFDKAYDNGDIPVGQEFLIKRGNIFPNPKALEKEPNEILIFDIVNKEYEDCSFRGFLYPNGSVNGKIKYLRESEMKDELVSGRYEKHRKRFLIIGEWFDEKNVPYKFVLNIEPEEVENK